MKLRATLFGILMLITTLPMGAGERITVKVSPAVAFAPANLVVRTMIEADQDNRAVEIVAESADFYRSSQIQLEGDRAPRTTNFEFRSLPPGTYEVRALLIGTGGEQRAFARQHDQRHRERRGALITELRTERPAFDGERSEDRSLQSRPTWGGSRTT